MIGQVLSLSVRGLWRRGNAAAAAGLLLVLGLWLLPLQGQAADLKFGQGLLWRIERGEAPPSFIFGTMHVAEPRILDLPEPVSRAFDNTEQAVFELLFDNETLQALAQAVALPSGEHLEEYLDEATYGRLVDLAARFGLPPEAVGSLQPWAVFLVFSMPPAEWERQALGTLVLDEWLQRRAQSQGKEVSALERPDEQVAIFTEMLRDDQVALLKDSLRPISEIEDNFEMMIEAYLIADLNPLNAMMDDLALTIGHAATDRIKRRLLFDRNYRMAERMQPLLKQGNTFVAVGALHLPGEEGILALLEMQGYRVTRVY